MLKIKRNSNDNVITVGLTTKSDLTGLSESNESFYLNELQKSINSAEDEEIIVFKYRLNTIFFSFAFNPSSATLTSQGFTEDEINAPSEGLQRSFFFYQVFDSPNVYNQNLLYTNYYNGFDFFTNGDNTIYDVSRNIFTNINIARNQMGGIADGKLYLRFYFFNGKTGEVKTLINREKQNLTTTDKIFHEMNLNLSDNTYTFSTLSTSITLRVIETDNPDYANKINNNQQKQLNQSPQTPIGSGFNDDGTYEEI